MWRQARARYLFIYLFTFLLKLKYTILEIRESQDREGLPENGKKLKGNKATGKKIYELKNLLNLYKETKQNFNNQNED